MEASNMKAMREALEYVLDDYADDSPIAEIVRAALAKPPRACDVMSQEDLTKVVISGFMKSLGIGPENQLVSELAGAAISAAIKCAYDTQLVVKKGGEK